MNISVTNIVNIINRVSRAQRHGKFIQFLKDVGGEYEDVTLLENSLGKCRKNIEAFLFFAKRNIKFSPE